MSYLSKFLRQAVVDQLHAHLERNNLWVKCQSAYWNGHSTKTALLSILNDLLATVDGGNIAVLVLLDSVQPLTLLVMHYSCEDFVMMSVLIKLLLAGSQHTFQIGPNKLWSSRHSLRKLFTLHCSTGFGPQTSPNFCFVFVFVPLANAIQRFSVDYHIFCSASVVVSWSWERLMCSLVTFIFLYACESWTLTAELQRRI